MITGTVKFFNTTKGFGFIAPEDGSKDVFVHISAVERSGLGPLVEGQKVSFEVQADANVPSASGKAKVIRKKGTGDWRQWFTEEDMELFKPAYLPYMELIGYDCDDWQSDPNPVIEPEFSSVYLQSLPRKAPKNKILRHIDLVIQKLTKRG